MKRFRRTLRRLGDEEAGRRFQNLHPPQGEGSGQPPWERGLKLLLGPLLILGGLFLLAVPGPGLLVILLGMAVLASGFRPVARLLDRVEVAARSGLQGAALRWREASLAWKVFAGILVVILLIGVGCGVLLMLA